MNAGAESKKVIGGNAPFLLFFALFALRAWNVAAPIISPVLWAALISFISAPIYRFINGRLLRKRFPGVASCLTLAAFMLICIAPVVYALSGLGLEAARMGAEISRLFAVVQRHAAAGELALPSWVPAWVADYIRSFLDNSEAVKAALSFVAEKSAKLLSSLSASVIEGGSSLILNILIAAMISFFFIRDGDGIVTSIKSMAPLSDDEREYFFRRTYGILNSIVYGMIITAALQALIGGVGWWFVGLSSPALFGMLMFFFGMFPVGTAAVWVPGSIYLAATGDLKSAAILFAWGFAIVGTIDNLLRPFLISASGGGCEISTLLVTMGLFGGVMVWGFLGIFLGPLVLVLFATACDLYRRRGIGRDSAPK